MNSTENFVLFFGYVLVRLRLENYRICKFIWTIANVPCTRHQINYVRMFFRR